MAGWDHACTVPTAGRDHACKLSAQSEVQSASTASIVNYLSFRGRSQEILAIIAMIIFWSQAGLHLKTLYCDNVQAKLVPAR